MGRDNVAWRTVITDAYERESENTGLKSLFLIIEYINFELSSETVCIKA